MDIDKTLKSLIPNPFSKKGNLTDLVKKTELIREGANLISIIRNILGIFIIAFLLNSFLKIPIQLIIIFAWTELLVILTNFSYTFTKIQSIKVIGTQKDAESYLKILLISEKYDTIKTGIATVETFIGTCFIFFIINSNILKLNIPFNIQLFILCFLLASVVSRLFTFIMSLTRYNLIRKIAPSNDFAKINKDYVLIGLKMNIVRDLLVIAIMIIILMTLFLLFSDFIISYLSYSTDPLIFLIGPILIISFFLMLDILSYRRLKKVDFNNNQAADTNNNPIIAGPADYTAQYQDEKILGSIFGISKSVASFKDIFTKKVGSYSVLGTGKNFAPENTLLITNYRLLFIQVPVSGGDKVINGVDYAQENFLFNRSNIQKNGEEMLKNNSIPQLLPLIRNEILYKDIKNLIINKYIIRVETEKGDKLRYAFMDKEYLGLLDKILPEYLGTKMTSK